MNKHLRQILLAQGAVGIVVQAAFQAFEAEGVSTGGSHRLIEQSEGQTAKITLLHFPTADTHSYDISDSEY